MREDSKIKIKGKKFFFFMCFLVESLKKSVRRENEHTFPRLVEKN